MFKELYHEMLPICLLVFSVSSRDMGILQKTDDQCLCADRNLMDPRC